VDKKYAKDPALYRRIRKQRQLRELMLEEGITEKIGEELWGIPMQVQRKMWMRTDAMMYPEMDAWMISILKKRRKK
jgi:hypothetical protein